MRHSARLCRSLVSGVALVIGAALVVVSGCGSAGSGQSLIAPAIASSETNETVLDAPSVVDLGTVPAGGRVERTIEIHNPHPHDVAVAEVEVGCECITFTLESDVIDAGRSVSAKVIADLSHQPDFRGSLGVLVTLKDGDGSDLQPLRVDLNGGAGRGV